MPFFNRRDQLAIYIRSCFSCRFFNFCGTCIWRGLTLWHSSPNEVNIIIAHWSIESHYYYFNVFYSCVYSLRSDITFTGWARFTGSGTRLLCNELGRSQLAVYNFSTQQQQPSNYGKILLKAQDFNSLEVGYSACCFAGTDDELIISAADDHNLFTWSLPGENDGDGQDLIVYQSTKILKGHKDAIRCVRANKEQPSISSCGDDGVVKLWTPGASQ